MALFSGSPQWTRHQALADALTGPIDSPVELRLLGADGGSRTVTSVYREVTSGQRVREPKPDPITELAPGIVYVDLDRVTEAQFRQREADLVAARGLVFDLRGYPRMPPAFLARLADRPVQSAQFDAPIYLRPGQQGVTYHSGGWNMAPVAPSFTDNVAFITNGSAISFAESVLGLVAANRLADIVGEPSAGANGNVSSFLVPGGYRLLWTAMRVVNRDGSQHHLKGVQPNIPTRRTLAGVRAGRDELLERALETVTRRLEPRPAG